MPSPVKEKEARAAARGESRFRSTVLQLPADLLTFLGKARIADSVVRAWGGSCTDEKTTKQLLQ